MHRLQGDLLRSETVNRRVEAEASFQRAIEVARGQHAKSLELRAALSLGRLWRDEGRQEHALRLLSEVYGWFTEGFDTPDMREARSLLEAFAPEVYRAGCAGVGSSPLPKSSAAHRKKQGT